MKIQEIKRNSPKLMITKIKIKNPGCQFCRYFVPSFRVDGKKTKEACRKGARRVFQKKPDLIGKRKWKWGNCSFSHEKNKDRFCSDFQIKSLVINAMDQLILTTMKADKQMPPTYKKEKWWKT